MHDNEAPREIFHHTRIVITRKPHECFICYRTLPVGTKAAKQYSMVQGELPKGTYCCQPALLSPEACPFDRPSPAKS